MVRVAVFNVWLLLFIAALQSVVAFVNPVIGIGEWLR